MTFKVNPQFMICPTFALQGLFASEAFPKQLLFPSYRTTVNIIFSAVSMVEAYIYIGVSKIFTLFSELRSDIKSQIQHSGKQKITDSSNSSLDVLTSGKLMSVQGMRGLLSLWVVACHVATFLAYVQTVHVEKWRIEEVDKSIWFVFANGLGYQVDAFFMISGKLFTHPPLPIFFISLRYTWPS